MNKVRDYIAFDQYQRYETIFRFIQYHQNADPQKKYRILELGANEHKVLKLFLPNAEILFTDVVLSDVMKADVDFQQVDGTNLFFEDQSFDFVVAADVLEHVRAEKREQFLTEAYRVASEGVIICFPYDTQDIIDAERRVNTYFKTVSGKDFTWLKEHSVCGLPKLDEINEILNNNKISSFHIFHGAITTWEKMWYCHLATFFTPETSDYCADIDHYYNSTLYESDISNSCYRAFYVLSRKNTAEWEVHAKKLWKPTDESQLQFLDTLLQMRQNVHSLYEQGRLQQVVFDKERHIQNQDAILEAVKQQLGDVEKRETFIQQELAHYKEHYFSVINQREALKIQIAQLQLMYDTISNATSWKMTKPIRLLFDVMKRVLKSNRYTYLFCKGFKCLKENGFRYTWRKLQDKLRHKQDYLTFASRPLFTKEELEAQRQYIFSKKIKFSIVVPLYNTPSRFLHEMIRSVLDQTYGDWELCLADGSDEAHGEVGQICCAYMRKDSRIKYQKLKENRGISENTNACLDMACGDYIGLFDHDDLLHPAALYEVMKAICEQGADFIYTDESTFRNKPEDAFCPHFKPDFAPDTLRSYNYICHFTVFSKVLMEKSGGGFRSEFDGSQDYDLVLRLTEKAEKIVHIPEILYYWRSHANSVASNISAKSYSMTAAKRALAEHLKRVGLKGEVCDSKIPSTYQIIYELTENPLVSILIPNKDHINDLKKCIDSIIGKTTYSAWEIVVIENNSTQQETFEYYGEIQKDKRIRVVYWENEFNYSAINNFGAKSANGEYLLLLNNDVEIITSDWIEQMLMFGQRSDVGAVGCMLYYPDDTVQHAGVVLGIGGVAGHAHKYFRRGDHGYMSRMTIAQNYSVVTAACVLIRRDVWVAVDGLDESFKVAFNDVDLCMRIRKAGYLVVWTPYAELYHYESKSRGLEDTLEKQKRFAGEVHCFQSRWRNELDAGDPYYSPNFTLEREDFSLK